ncbi:MAG: hypothetical protein ACYC35_24200 [Pirellulales bacterium]
MNLDIRFPTGLLFLIIGAILTVYGVVTHWTDPAMYDRSLEVNVNLWWGLALIVFSAVMLLLARRASRIRAKSL